VVFSVSPTKKPDPDKGLVVWLKTADGEYLCPRVRWHRSIYVYMLKFSWGWPPIRFFHGWACTDCEEC
jgi:hypothetical protein